MPDPGDCELMVASATGHWGTLRLTGPGQLRLTSDALVLDAAHGASLRTRYSDLLGGGWRIGAITIHGTEGTVTIEASRGLDAAWATLVARACPLPELARGHRLLGSRRGGSTSAQARFLAPLLQARRNLEEQPDLDIRVSAFDARALRERIDTALQGIAKDTFPTSDPDCRALEAELEEAMGSLFRGLDVMEAAAKVFRSAGEPVRFLAWREWVSTVGFVFALADRDWSNAARLLPNPFTQ